VTYIHARRVVALTAVFAATIISMPRVPLVNAAGFPVYLLTVHQSLVQCRTVNASPGSGDMVTVHGFFQASRSSPAGSLRDTKGAKSTSKGTGGGTLHVMRAPDMHMRFPDRTWMDVDGTLRCSRASPVLVATGSQLAGAGAPALQVFLTVTPPRVVHVHESAVFRVTTRFVGPLPLQAYYVDFHLSGAWDAPDVATPDGSEACGGDNIPQTPSFSHGYWHLDFGDCRTINLVLIPRTRGEHSLTLRPFRVPISDRGMPQLNRRIEEPRHRYVWHGFVQP
jgi:hypothetical protein